MTATTALLWELRRMVNEPDYSGGYDTARLTAYIERYPLLDADGNEPDDDDWTATYDLHQAAADIWAEKATAKAGDFDFGADGGNYHRSQAFKQYMAMSRYHAARRAIGTVRQQMHPRPVLNDTPWLGNLAEDDE